MMVVKKSVSGGFAVVACAMLLACSGCVSERLVVHGKSGIISHDAQRQLGRLASEDATEQDVLSLFGEPSSTVLAGDGSRSLYYNCVVTNLKAWYLFTPTVTEATWQDTGIHTCRVYLSQDGRVRDVDYQHGTSNKTMHPMPLPRPE